MKRRHAALAGVLLVALAAGFGWLAVRRWWLPRWDGNVLIITLDTTRADRLGCYGYPQAETPALDRLASGGLRFARAYSHVPLTLPSHATIMTGRLPPEHGLRDNGRGALGPDIPTLAETFRRHGYRTAAFVATFSLDKRFGLNRGFEVYDDRMQPASKEDELLEMENPGDVVCDRALAWLAQRSRERFFCWVHFYDPHAPYVPPEPYRSRHPLPYDGEIAFMDAQVGRLMAFLEQHRLDGRTLVVVCGDHGESFGEHREDGHGQFVYDATLRVPLIVSGPGRVPAGRTESRVVGLEDVAPTVLRLVGRECRPSLRGEDLVNGTPSDRGCYGESQSAYFTFGWSPLYSLTTARWKYIQCPNPELYDLQNDPAETRNLAAAEPAAAVDMDGRLERLRQAMKSAQPAPVSMDAKALQTLRSLGYLSGSASPTPAGAKGLKDPKSMMDVYEACFKAQDFVSQRRYREAIDTLTPFASRSPESVQIYETLAQCYSNLRQHDEAARQMEGVLALTPENRTMAADLAVTRMEQGDPAKAVEILRRTLTLPPGPLEPTTQSGVSKIGIKMHADLASALYQFGQLDEAAAECELALRDDPGHTDAHTTLGNIRNQQGRFDEAVRHYRAILSQTPDDASSLSNLGVALTRMGRLGEAIEAHRKAIAADPGSADFQMNFGATLMAAQKTDEALDAFRAAVRVSPGRKAPLMSLASALMYVKKDEEALRAYEQILSIEKSPDIYHGIGTLCDRLGRRDDAIAAYRQALALAPGAVSSRSNLGLILCGKKQYADALALWREGLTIQPGSATLIYNMAWWLATCPDPACRNGEEAVGLAERLNRSASGTNPFFLDAVAASYAETGKFDKAAETATKALELARKGGADALATSIEQRLALYRASKPYHQ